MELFAKLQRMIDCGSGLLLPFRFVAAWTAILVHVNFARPGFHRGGGHVEERDSEY